MTAFITPLRFSSSSSLPLTLRLSPRQSTNLMVAMSMKAGVGVMGTKLGMMSYFEPKRIVVPVTVVGFHEGNIVTQVKNTAIDGYNAIQVSYNRRTASSRSPSLATSPRLAPSPCAISKSFASSPSTDSSWDSAWSLRKNRGRGEVGGGGRIQLKLCIRFGRI